MRYHEIPYEFTGHEERLGGKLSFRQFIYIILSIASFGIFALPLWFIVKLFIVFVLVLFFMLSAFLKIGIFYFDTFTKYAIQYILREKFLLYRR